MNLIKTESELRQIIKSSSNCLIYYFYQKCGDCIYFEENYLKDFLKNNDEEIYLFEMSKYFDFKKNNEIDKYIEFCNEFGLSSLNHLGYKNGVVPTLINYQNGEAFKVSVIFNDEMEKEFDENQNLKSIKIISSFYDDNLNIGKIYLSDEQENAKIKYYKDNIDFYINKFERDFLWKKKSS